MSRAYLRQSSVIVLDEPTGHMDPWAESEFHDRFRNLAKGQTAVIITHRFSTARHADIIHVVDKGRIIESGSHDELLSQNGRYAWGWQQQMHQETGIDLRVPA